MLIMKLLLDGNGEWKDETVQQYQTFDVEYVSLDSAGNLYIASRLHNFSNEKEAEGDLNTAATNGQPGETLCNTDNLIK